MALHPAAHAPDRRALRPAHRLPGQGQRVYPPEEQQRFEKDFPDPYGGFIVIPLYQPKITADEEVRSEPGLLFPMPHATQSLCCLPSRAWLGKLLDHLPGTWPAARTWLEGEAVEAGVWDRERRGFLWSMTLPARHEGRIRLSKNYDYLLCERDGEWERTITVLKWPLPAHWPWWPHSAGLLVAALVLVARRWCRASSVV